MRNLWQAGGLSCSLVQPVPKSSDIQIFIVVISHVTELPRGHISFTSHGCELNTFGTAMSMWIINNVQEEMPEAILAAVFVEGTADGYNFLGSRRHPNG